MKKVLSFVLVLAMVLGSVAMAFAKDFPDMEGSKYESAVENLSELGVLDGYEDGTFKADREIKRSEFAKVVITALGLTPTAASATQFSDVEAGKWYTPYVALAAQLGIVNGFGDGTFRPDQTITDTQAIVMVVRALGYTDDYFGGYNSAKYISQATALGLMKDVNAGTGASTRGNVAQLVNNALDVQIKKIDKDGNASNTVLGDTMQARLSGYPYQPTNGSNPGDPFVLSGPQAAKIQAGSNLTSYYGKYVTAISKDQAAGGTQTSFKSVNAVLSTTLVGTFDGASTFTLADGTTKYTFSGATGGAVVAISNGAFLADAPLPIGSEVTIEAEVNGVYIPTVYSWTDWTETETFQMEKDDLDATACTLNGHAFLKNNMAKIDDTKFQIVGADNLEAIKVGDVVTVYENAAGNVTKVEVSTKTVEGAITEKTSAGKYVIGGTQYAPYTGKEFTLSTSKGTAYFAYDGSLFAFVLPEDAAPTYLYGIMLDRVNGSTGINTSEAKVQLFTAEGSTSTLVGANAATAAAPNKQWTGSAATVNVGESVMYAVNASGQVSTMASIAGGAHNAKVEKDGSWIYSDGKTYKLTADTKLLQASGTSYKVVKAADLYGQTVTLSAVQTKGTAVLYAFVEGNNAGTANPVVMFNGYTEGLDANGNPVVKVNVLEKGAAGTYTAAATNAAFLATSTGVLQTVTAAGTQLSAYAAKACTAYAITTTKAAVSNGILTITADNNAQVAVASDVIVYVFKSGAWTVGAMSDVTSAGNGSVLRVYVNDANAAAFITVGK